MSSLGFHTRSDPHQLGQNMGTSVSPRLTRRRSLQSLDADPGLSRECPSPAMWMASRTIYDVDSTVGRSGTPKSGLGGIPNLIASPLAPIRVPSSAGSTASLSPRDSVSSQFSSTRRVTSPTSFLSIGSTRENQISTDGAGIACSTVRMPPTPRSPVQPRLQTPPTHMNTYATLSQHQGLHDAQMDSTGASGANLPQRYAPRRPSGLRQTPIQTNGQLPAMSQPSHDSRDSLMNARSRSFHLPGRPPMQRRRGGSMASLSRLSIPEQINEELHEILNSSNSMDQRIWIDNATGNDESRLQSAVPPIRKPTTRPKQCQQVVNRFRSSTPSLQRGIYHGHPEIRSSTPSEGMLEVKCPVTLVEVIEEKQRQSRRPSRSERTGPE